MIAAITPTGSRTISELPTCCSHSCSASSWGIEPNVVVGSPAWMRLESLTGIPTSWVINAAISSMRAPSAAAMRPIQSERSCTEVCDQLSNAARAAATALSTSSIVPSGTDPITCSVVELITSRTPAPVALTHSPPM